MTTAPLELVMIALPGRQFSPEILSALQDVVDRGTIRIVDAVLVAKGDDGTPVIVEVESDDHGLAPLRAIVGDINGLIAEEDAFDLAAGLAPGHTAGIILLEHTWASDFADAVKSANGEVLVSLRIPPDVVDEVVAAQADEG